MKNCFMRSARFFQLKKFQWMRRDPFCLWQLFLVVLFKKEYCFLPGGLLSTNSELKPYFTILAGNQWDLQWIRSRNYFKHLRLIANRGIIWKNWFKRKKKKLKSKDKNQKKLENVNWHGTDGSILWNANSSELSASYTEICEYQSEFFRSFCVSTSSCHRNIWEASVRVTEKLMP